MISRREFAGAGAAAFAGLPEDDPARVIFRRVNELRAARGVEPLRWAGDLAAAAKEQSDRKAVLRFPGHEDPERGGIADRLTRAGIRWSYCGENVFSMEGYEDVANFAVIFWWYSLGHQKNMVSPDYTETGVGISRGADGVWFATQVFARRRV